MLATFRCFANRYFYSRGFQWGLEGKNGILEFPGKHMQAYHFSFSLLFVSANKSELLIHLFLATAASQIEVQSFSSVMSTINLEIDENVHSAVYCFVPLLDSHAWANSTFKFPINQLQVNI